MRTAILIAFAAVIFIPMSVSAGTDQWTVGSVAKTTVQKGNKAQITNTGVSTSETLNVADCRLVRITIFDDDLTVMPQLCVDRFAAGDTPTASECKDIRLTDLDATGTHSDTIDPVGYLLMSFTANTGTVEVECIP